MSTYEINMDLRVVLAVQMWTAFCLPPDEDPLFTVPMGQGPYFNEKWRMSVLPAMQLRECVSGTIAASFQFTAPVPREAWDKTPATIAEEHFNFGMEPRTYMQQQCPILLISNRYIKIEDVDPFRSLMDARIDMFTKTKRALNDLLSTASDRDYLDLCQISYRFES